MKTFKLLLQLQFTKLLICLRSIKKSEIGMYPLRQHNSTRTHFLHDLGGAETFVLCDISLSTGFFIKLLKNIN